jgi:nicotinamidase-related amidase
MMADNGLKRSALLVIDVQRALFEKTIPIYKAEELLHNIQRLVNRAHQSGSPVIFVQHANDSFLVKDSEGWQLHPALKPDAVDLIIHKQHGSALQDTPLQHELQSRSIDTLIVTGLVTHGCVKATCQDAQKHGYHVILVEDGHSNYHKQAAALIQEWNQKLRDEGIHLVPTLDLDFEALSKT